MSDPENDAPPPEGSEAEPPGTGSGEAPTGPAELADLKQLGRYKILGELGRGAMGIVFEAVDPKIGRKVALKVLLSVPGISDSELEEFRSRFFREARTAGMLAHPNIVVIHDVDHDDELGISYMAMEYLKGQTLYDLLRSGVKFTREQTIDLCIQVAEGLDHAHRQGITHRDVKPANLMLLEDGTVKVTDFGIAKISTSNLTRTGQFLGTPNYMSPEQVIGHVIDGRSDLFGLGIILYELLTGEKPFMGSSLTTITYQIVNVDPIEPSKIQPGIPKVFDEIAGRLLKKAPDERYQTGKEAADALRAAREALGGGANATGTALPSTRPTGGASPDATVAGTSPSILSVSEAAAQQAAPAPAAAREGPNRQRLLIMGISAGFLLVTAVLVAMSLPGGDEIETPPTPAPNPAVTPPVATGGGTVEAVVTEPVPTEPEPTTPTRVEPPPREPSPVPVKPPPEPAPRVAEPPVRRAPEPEPRIVPRQAEPLPVRPRETRTAPPPAARLQETSVDLRFEHRLKAGTLRIEVDGDGVASYPFTAEKKKGGSLQASFSVSEGTHAIRVCLDSDDMKDRTICAHRQHRFVMNTNATLRALHQKPPLGRDKFSFEIE